jgi:hypothetical protein
MRIQNFKTPADALPSCFSEGDEVSNKKNFNILNIIRGDNSWRFILNIGYFFVLIIERTAHRLQIEFISTQLMDQHLILLIEFVETADKQLITVVMYLMHVSGSNILDRVEKRDDISKLDDVQQRESELLCLERDST